MNGLALTCVPYKRVRNSGSFGKEGRKKEGRKGRGKEGRKEEKKERKGKERRKEARKEGRGKKEKVKILYMKNTRIPSLKVFAYIL